VVIHPGDGRRAREEAKQYRCLWSPTDRHWYVYISFNDAADLLKFNAFLLVAPSSDAWAIAPTRAVFRDRCLRADQRAFSCFLLPFLAGGVSADDDEEDSAAYVPAATTRPA
jgi:hypothetical protein